MLDREVIRRNRYNLDMEIVIRHANESDVTTISRLQHQWAEEGSVWGYTPETQEQIESGIGPYFLLAEDNNVIIGFTSGSIHRSENITVIPEGASYLEIDNLYILPEYRGYGVGSKLLDRSLTQAKEAGIAYALLYSAAKDIHSVLRFYEQHNFQSWNVQMFRKL